MIVYEKDKEYDKNLVGGKGYGLFRLVRYGFCVPDFFVIEAGTDLADKSVLDALKFYADKLDCETFSVRSSGVSEDGANASFAGQYHTELNVPKSGLVEAVYKVCASANDKGAKAYSKRFGILSCNMAIIVQRQITGTESGVLFSTAPQEQNSVLIERVMGGGENLVSGKTIPQTLCYRKGETANGYEKELLSAAKFLEEHEGCPVDVEWTYDGKLWFLQLRCQTVLSDDIPSIPDRNWKLYVYRDFTVFNHSIQVRASQEDIQRKTFGFYLPVTEGLLICGREFYSDENDAAVNAVWEQVDQGDFFEGFLNRIEEVVNCTKRRTAAVKKKDFSKLSEEKLFMAYEREIAAYLKSYVPMMMRPDEYLRDCLVRLAGEERANEFIGAAAALLPPTFYSNERICFLRAVACGNGRKYLGKYEWKNNPLGKRFLPVSEREFRARAAGITPEQARKLININRMKKRAEVAHARKIIASADDRIARLIGLILQFTYYRTRTAEISDRYFYYIRKNLLSELARRFGLSDETLLLYRADEIFLLREGKRLSETEMTKRKNGEAVIFQDGKCRTYFGMNAYNRLKRLLPVPEKGGIFHGKIACAGEVTGTVKVVKCFSDAEQMEAGNILVASMTTPDLALALEKAIGIITDEGGITCHAAIIAREYSIPCLVATKVATQVLSDGMKITLDCINGCFYVEDAILSDT